VPDPVDPTHRAPPPNTWGTGPLGGNPSAWDVLPTQMQDNDPIRRTCAGSTVGNINRAGEEVCNLDGNLGLVLPMVDSLWISGQSFNGGPALPQYATALCDGSFVPSIAPQVFDCPSFGVARNHITTHDGQCPSGDSEIGGSCQVPLDSASGTSACLNDPAQTPVVHVRPSVLNHGRVYNLFLTDGTNGVHAPVRFAPYPLPALELNGVVPTVDMAGAFNRIHQMQTMLGREGAACQLASMTDQIGCLVAADPCSIGFAPNEALVWKRPQPVWWGTGALLINGVAPSTASVQVIGKGPEYPIARKLYLTTLAGFDTVAAGATAGDPTALNEMTLATDESNRLFIDPILSSHNYFPLGNNSPNGVAGTPYCEDFNEQTICSASSNTNGCFYNASVGLPSDPSSNPALSTTSTVCGNGKLEAGEECDTCVNGGTGGCSNTCHRILDMNKTTGICN
jgi:hypothetical protein